MYFAYKTTTFVKYENISKISLPAITICFRKQDVLKSKDPDQPQEVNEMLESMANLSIKTQLDMMYDFNNSIGNCYVMKTVGLYKESTSPNPSISCDQISPIRRSIDYER